MQGGERADPVEEVTVQLGNLEITVKVRQLANTSGASSSSGFELVARESSAASVVLPIAEPDSSTGELALALPSLDQRVLDASTTAALAALPLDFLGYLRKRLRAAGRGASSKAPALRPSTMHQESVYAEIEKEVEDPQDGNLALLPDLIAGTDDPLQKLLAMQMQQNALLLQKVLGSRPHDPILGVLAGSGSSSSEGGSALLGRLFRRRFRTLSRSEKWPYQMQ